MLAYYNQGVELADEFDLQISNLPEPDTETTTGSPDEETAAIEGSEPGYDPHFVVQTRMDCIRAAVEINKSGNWNSVIRDASHFEMYLYNGVNEDGSPIEI